MTHFGILCPPATGHLNPMTALGRELKLRGHRVTLFGIPDAQPKTQIAGLEFWAIGESEFPAGFMAESLGKVGKLSGFAAGQYTLSLIQQGAAMLLRSAPKALKAAGVEALLVDQTTGEGGTVADFLGIPFITVYSALIVNQEDSVPPFFTSWSYNPVWWARLRNRAGYGSLTLLTQPIRQVVNEYRQQWKLPPYSHPSQNFSKLAQLSQQPAEFEFPRQHLPECFHFTGPYHNPAGRQPVSFPFQKLTGQPLIYASMGTVQNRLLGIFKSMAEACVGLDAQLVISLGGSTNPESLQGLPGNTLVVGYAPQLELLQKATLTITHAGLNTALESLSNGVPMVAIPIANDQPGVAARIAWTGAGEFVPLKKLSVPKLRTAIQQVLTEESYKKNATRLQEAIRRAGGVSRAADIIEQVISTGKPVLRGN
jgi:zeaxanthin glucosyltransferase